MTSVSWSSSTSQSSSPEGEGCSSTCSSSKRAVAGTLISGEEDGPRGTFADRKATTLEPLSSLDDVFDPYVREDARSCELRIAFLRSSREYRKLAIQSRSTSAGERRLRDCRKRRMRGKGVESDCLSSADRKTRKDLTFSWRIGDRAHCA